MTNSAEDNIPDDQPCGASLTANCFNGADGCPVHPVRIGDVKPSILDDANRIGALPTPRELVAVRIEELKAADAVSAERFGPVEAGDALARFDDFTAHLVDWFRKNGEVPLPHYVGLDIQVTPEVLERLADQFGEVPYGGKHPQFSFDLSAYGNTAHVIVHVAGPDRPL